MFTTFDNIAHHLISSSPEEPNLPSIKTEYVIPQDLVVKLNGDIVQSTILLFQDNSVDFELVGWENEKIIYKFKVLQINQLAEFEIFKKIL